jgi:hypothetical protein
MGRTAPRVEFIKDGVKIKERSPPIDGATSDAETDSARMELRNLQKPAPKAL